MPGGGSTSDNTDKKQTRKHSIVSSQACSMSIIVFKASLDTVNTSLWQGSTPCGGRSQLRIIVNAWHHTCLVPAQVNYHAEEESQELVPAQVNYCSENEAQV